MGYPTLLNFFRNGGPCLVWITTGRTLQHVPLFGVDQHSEVDSNMYPARSFGRALTLNCVTPRLEAVLLNCSRCVVVHRSSIEGAFGCQR